jgi:hypothetical protein
MPAEASLPLTTTTGRKRFEDRKQEDLKMAIESDLIQGDGGLLPHPFLHPPEP